ncbi:MAG: lipopolysaccharide heptosyltransferase II [Calditrichia bacterium]
MKIQNILLIRTDRIGDIILTTPAITLLRENYPQARILFLTRSYTAPLLKHHRDLNEIIIYEPEGRHRGFFGHLRLAKELRREDIDLAFLFYPTADLAIALRVAGIKYRVGTGYRWYSFLLNKRIFEHRKYGDRHELECNLSLMKNFIKRLPEPGEIEFHFTQDDTLQQLHRQACQSLGIGDNYIIIHPGSGGSAPNLPPEMFRKILEYLGRNTRLDILLIGTTAEKDLIESIAGGLANHPRIKTVLGWDLETYLAVIARCKLFISNSTGPLHMARAFDIPLLAFYCPAIPCSPRRWGPYNRPEYVLMPEIEPCKNCNISQCPHGNCLSKIPWEAIEDRLKALLKEL